VAIDCCEECLNCQKIEHGNHADVFWVRPESKLRVIKINQVTRRDDSPPRVLLEFVNLKPTESPCKIGIIVGADRMNEQAANAFLKTLEEPPQNSVLVLLTTEPERVLDTIRSRCLRLMFAGEGRRELPPPLRAWLTDFSNMAAAGHKSLLGRYRLMDVLLKKLNELKAGIDEGLTARSPLQLHKDAEKDLQEKWEDELKAAIEAEYRRQRTELLAVLQAWLRDVWLHALGKERRAAAPHEVELLNFPDLPGSKEVAQRLTSREAAENLRLMEQLQRILHTNVQEALALEVGLLKLTI
jgi:DNA polymerase-3 subunit delta'